MKIKGYCKDCTYYDIGDPCTVIVEHEALYGDYFYCAGFSKIYKSKLKLYRENKGFTQEYLATKLNTVRENISNWERGRKIPKKYISKINNILDCNL